MTFTARQPAERWRRLAKIMLAALTSTMLAMAVAATTTDNEKHEKPNLYPYCTHITEGGRGNRNVTEACFLQNERLVLVRNSFQEVYQTLPTDAFLR